MLALHAADAGHLIASLDWVEEDFARQPKRHYLKHDWQGTVIRTGGYHYDLPSATTTVNTDLLHFMPAAARKIVEIGCGDGAFAKAYKQRNPICNYTGVETDPARAQAARPHCDFVFNTDLEHAGPDFWDHVRHADTWVFDETLEQMDDPWRMLQRSAPTSPPAASWCSPSATSSTGACRRA